MIRAVMTGRTGRKILILGFDEVNLKRLVAGDSMLVKSETVGNIGIDVVIMYGETTKAIIDELRGHGFDLPTDPEVGVTYEGSAEGYQIVDKKKG